MAKKTMREARQKRGETLEQVAEAIGADISTVSRVERGTQLPSKDLARKLFEHFDGAVELGRIYDPEHRAAS